VEQPALAVAPVPAAGQRAARLRRLTIRDFRNLAHVVLDVPPRGLALVGDNGQGKSNLLEAVYYMHLFRSSRGARDTELVRFGAPGFHVAGMAEGTRVDLVAAGFDRETGRRRITLDGVECARVSDALGAIPAVTFAPTDVALVAGAPVDRRHFLDLLLASSSRRYLGALRDYRTALAQRNAALRAGTGRSQAAVWEVALATNGAVLRLERAAFVTWCRPRIAAIGDSLAEYGSLDVRYRASVAIDPDADEDAARDALAAALAGSRDRDLERGMTLAGPHRDDLDLRVGEVSLRRFGSAGQQRSAAIALRLLECGWSRERGECEPVMLLDDPLAELDRGRAARVLDLFTARPAGQVILAVPRDDDVPEALSDLARCEVRGGVVKPVGDRGA